MYHHTLHLKEHISFLQDTSGDPVVSVYLPDNLAGTVYYEYGPNKLEQAAKAYWDAIKK